MSLARATLAVSPLAQCIPKPPKGDIIPYMGSQAQPTPFSCLLRRPSVQTTCSGQCCCTVVCTLVRLGMGQHRHGFKGEHRLLQWDRDDRRTSQWCREGNLVRPNLGRTGWPVLEFNRFLQTSSPLQYS
uniref:Uncharacterized protein n=1 Tax=Leptobrachium leishanense TaxID=445787 RepID=A0A8C5PHP1_9ANUR